ncbi:7-carboxy-7-deazaguanine synthase [Paenibacillus baekrokdamisoli]|uniref:7-carboxy-7-deazaguanine synthase n=1 Tax=Paenibacillus baekrokdamisoli TaxID=1712516 RepID=A0A3G9JKN2_9BACL|nr:7-carboxy-7-deazaguanine synthase QueE [Paenibacillus baekrokdamisoli]MBB3068641.1 7-carboxy-7-deazaguanine synthase [Paenibacillus baekrokdamisoli]BBH23474.1 7-carboxy-7-deazaguanine synthase [Paenibacillus baekrokdamisoli]
MSSRFPVMEIFGPTIQGEGMVIGQKTMFVRTAGCDYQCAWCDSAFTWDGTGKEDIRMLTAEEIAAELREIGGTTHVTISGGNPALLPHLNELIDRLHEQGITVALETQGSLWKNWFLQIDELTLSPKPPSSGMTTDWSQLDAIVAQLTEHERAFSLKVVVFDEADLQYAVTVHERYKQVPFYLQAGNDDVIQEDTSVLLNRLIERYKWLVDMVIASSALTNVRVLPQLHAWLWGNKRGK